VLNQDPLPGTGAGKGDLVNLSFLRGRGEEMILMLDFANREIGELEAWAREKGLDLDTQLKYRRSICPI